MNNLAPMKNCPGVLGNLNWTPGYIAVFKMRCALQSSNLLKLIPLVPRPRCWTCVCRFLLILFMPEFVIGVATFILKLSISHF